MKKNVAVALAGVLIVAVAGGWWSMSAHKSDTKTAKAPAAGGPGNGGAPALVTLATAQKQDVPVTVQVNGSVVSLNSVDLRPQVTNTVSTVHVKEGQFVKAGQLLFSLDDRNDQANLARARAQQQKDEATMADLERQYKRSQDLVAQNFIAKSAADATLSQLEAQRAAVAADRAAVQSGAGGAGLCHAARAHRGAHRRRQHLPGHAGAADAVAGHHHAARPDRGELPRARGQPAGPAAAARSRAKVEAVVTGRKEPLSGTLDFVDNTVDPTIGTVRAKAVFANADQSLWPGQFVGTRITVRSLDGATVVPAAALMMLSDGTSLYVVDEPGPPRAAR
jgi:multidrug efflux system membrane fusion protein